MMIEKNYFYEHGFGTDFTQLNIGLLFKIDESWSSIMSVMTRWSNEQEQIFGLEIDALTEV